MKRINFISLIFIMGFALSACQTANPASQSDLEGHTWLLQSYAGDQLIEGSRVTLQFADGQISGIAGCNHYGAGFAVKGQTISFSDIYATEMYCMDPSGIMDQEQSYLEALRVVNRFDLTDGELTLTTSLNQLLIFEIQPISTTPLPEPTLAVSPTSPPVDPSSTPEAVITPPAGFSEYQDASLGVSIYIPDSWLVSGEIEGQYAILQSYHADKYIGGEVRDPGDTKCDLSLLAADVTSTSYIQQLESSSTVTILSEREFVLQSGDKGMRLEIDSLGRSVLFLADLNHSSIALSCFGDLTLVDEIASTLRANN
jgi:heat shock protein HslJ